MVRRCSPMTPNAQRSHPQCRSSGLVVYFSRMRIADFKDRDVEGLDWLLGTVGTPAPELVEPPCAQIVRMNPENRLGKAGRV